MINNIDHYIIGSKWMAKLFPNNPKIQKRCSGNKDIDVLLGVPPENPYDYPDLSRDEEVISYFKSKYGSKTEIHHIPRVYLILMTIKYFDSSIKMEDVLFTLKASHVAWDTLHFALIMQGAKCVRSYGGEGKGDDYYTVWNFPQLSLYVQFQGWYASHVGAEYDNMYEVIPVEVIKIEYHRV